MHTGITARTYLALISAWRSLRDKSALAFCSRCALFLAFCAQACALSAATVAPIAPAAGNKPGLSLQAGQKNVILIIGDGMDNQQITIARNYLVGVKGKLTLDQMPQRSIAQVLTVAESAPHQAVYVADSANSATAIASGKVTSRGRIATSAGDDRDLPGIVQLAAAAGLQTGLVSTASVTDATVAAFYAHIGLRGCQNPTQMHKVADHKDTTIACADDLKANGGPGSIAEQLVDSSLDFALGGGLKHFIHPAEGGDLPLLALADKSGFNVLTNASQLQSAPANKRWLGLFANGTMPAVWRGENNRIAEKIERKTAPRPMSCEANPAFGNTPTLKLMTQRALDKLEHTASNGFFLMIESASIDKQAHIRNACGSIGEVKQLDQALEVAMAFAEKHPQTLVLVTADHGQAAQLIPNESLFKSTGARIYTPGKIARLKTVDNALMVVNYATNDISMEEHTGVSVPVLSNNKTSLPATMLQSDLFTVMTRYLDLPPSTQPTETN